MGQKRLSHDDGLALARLWQESGQQQSQFCREQGVSVHVLSYWRGRLRAAADSESVALLPVQAAPPTVPAGTVSFMRAADGGLRLCVDGPFDVATCRAALELLS